MQCSVYHANRAVEETINIWCSSADDLGEIQQGQFLELLERFGQVLNCYKMYLLNFKIGCLEWSQWYCKCPKSFCQLGGKEEHDYL